MSRYASALYKKRSRDANLLLNARPFYNSLENTLMQEPFSIYANILLLFEIAKLGQNILRHSVGEKRKRIHVSSNRERIGRISHSTRAALKETRLLSYNKTTNYF